MIVRAGMRPVDVLIVDEAAQSTEAETCIAFQVLYIRQNIVVHVTLSHTKIPHFY